MNYAADEEKLNYAEEREFLLNWLEIQLTGPAAGAEEELQSSPLERYSTGILFPVVLGLEGLDPGMEGGDADSDAWSGQEENDDAAEPAVSHRRYVPPSSVGFSFFVVGDVVRIEVCCAGACYEWRHDWLGQFVYARTPLGGDAFSRSFQAPAQRGAFRERVDVFSGRAALDVLWRPYEEGWIATLSLINQQELDVSAEYFERVQGALFEAALGCRIEQGKIDAYPRVDKDLLNEEEQELELQYQERGIYAVGHGAAVDWIMENGEARELHVRFLPRVEVPQMTADVAGPAMLDALSLACLSGEKSVGGVLADLENFIHGYGVWIDGQKSRARSFLPEDHAAAQRLVSRMGVARQRMQEGLCLLRSDTQAAEAFRVANQTMLMQMRQADSVRGKKRDVAEYRWRPFQLAFLLTTIKSTIQDEDAFHDIVDLIWFPTGGGKTEAYLGLIAFCIVWRRLKRPGSGGGTTVLMRYTLRLLTTDQFKRAARMICALELLRRQHSAWHDEEPVSIGLWVGGDASPNTFDEALKQVRGEKLERLVLTACPWCGAAFKAPENYLADASQFHFRCVNADCDFGREKGLLPCNVVDEALYRQPPTLLLATIDKFARLAWDERASVFFGGGRRIPPELIIQDELHLIAGALGSVAGLYEAALDSVLEMRGVRAKYIASTATICMAQDQVRRLYGRDLAVFPPPGLSCDDSYFARVVPLSERPGRLYVGYLAPHLNRQQCMAPLAAALLAAPEKLFSDHVDHEILLDAWWTQVIYHGSLKGVGNSHNAFNIDVRKWLSTFSAEFKQQAKETGDAASGFVRDIPRLAQLTSRFSAEENARTFARLENTRDSADCLDAVLATNMVSVGLDVARLALMIINGQPLTTAEYIQASSRVGRSDVPGLVFANYYRSQARSLSHYENFRPYHEAFYRFVEPASVTPYTWQARKRALHAALVIVIRHAGGTLLGNKEAGRFDSNSDYVKKSVETLKNRCRLADSERAANSAAHLDRLVEEWHLKARLCEQNKRQLNYQSRDGNADALLYARETEQQGLWPTLQSMRDVERTALLKTL